MKISELMAGVTPNASYEGWVTADDWVLAIDTKSSAGVTTEVKNYEVVQMGVEGPDANLNPVTSEKTYIRAGKSTRRLEQQDPLRYPVIVILAIQRRIFMLSHAMKYARGNAAVTNYVYFCMLNGKGEKGQVSVIVNSEGGGNAGESSSIDVNLQKIGAEPEEYTYSAE